MLIETEATEHVELRRALRDRQRTVIENGDGYARAIAGMPPIERRALVLIDPPYEDIARRLRPRGRHRACGARPLRRPA